MRRTTIVLLSAAALGGTALAAATAAAGGGWGSPHGGRASMLLEQLDTNGDGKLTQAEIAAARRDRPPRFDTGGDGALTLAEYEALWLDAMRRMMVRQFQANDTDGDGRVTVEEFQARFSDLVVELDRNGDGELTRDELRPQRHAGRRGGPPDAPRPPAAE